MRFSTLLPLLLAAGVVQAQRGGRQGQGQGQANNGQANNGQANNGQANNGQANNGQANNGQANNGQANNGQANNGQAANNNQLCLNQANVQTGSQNDGLADAEPGQAASATDNANFINFCTGKTITNGLQVKGGSCNGIVMGDIPSTANMVSAVFTAPTNGEQVPINKDLTFTVQVANLNAGSFTNPDNTYYAAPQAVNGGKITGHTHITCQFLGANSDSPTQPLNAQNFDFFKGINDDGNGQGALSATLAGGLPKAGFYRVCSMTSASNHQPVIMPVAQRGPQDDCIRFEVVANGQGANNGQANNGQANNGQANNGQANNGQANNGQANNGQANNGQANNGQANNGQANNGQANNGQANNGQANNGQANAGQANNGQANVGQQQQGQNSTQQGQGRQQGGGRRGRPRFGRPKFQARDFVA